MSNANSHRNYLQNLTLEQFNFDTPLKQMSKNYQVFNTAAICRSLLDLESNGEKIFELRQISARRTRPGSTVSVTKGVHLVRLKSVRPMIINGDTLFPEMIIRNSRDGSCSLTAEIGIFRLVCTNGLTVKSHDFGSIKCRHVGTPQEQALELLSGFVAQLVQVKQEIERLAYVTLTEEECIELAKKAANINRSESTTQTKFLNLNDEEAKELLTPLRKEDEGRDVWSVMNVLQEKIINGAKIAGKTKFRSVNRWSLDRKINQELYTLALAACEGKEIKAEGLHDESAKVIEDLLDERRDAMMDEERTVIQDVAESMPARREIDLPMPPKRIRVTRDGIRRYIDNPAYAEWLELQ